MKIIFLSGLLLLVSSVFFSPITRAEPPANNQLADAIVITSLPYSHQQQAVGITAEPQEVSASCAPQAKNSIWFQYTPAADEVVLLDTFESSEDTVLALWTGETHPLTQIACNDDTPQENAVAQSQLTVALTSNTRYFISVSTQIKRANQLTLQVQSVHPFLNDNLSQSLAIHSLPYTYIESTQAATVEPEEINDSQCGSSTRSVWFQYIADKDQSIVFDTFGSNFDTLLSLWMGNAHPLSEVACNNNRNTLQSQLTLATTAGSIYYIRIGHASSSQESKTGTLVFHATAFAPNDDLTHATQIAMLPYNITENLGKASVEKDEQPSTCAPYSLEGIWYQYTADRDQNVRFSTLGSNYDTVLSVWTGSHHPLTEVACNDNALTGNEQEKASLISVALKSNQTYFININRPNDKTAQLHLDLLPVDRDLIITKQPLSQTVSMGQRVELSVEVTGTEPFSYQWYQGKSGDVSTPQVNVQTLTTDSLTKTTYYWVRVTNATGSIDSDTAAVIIKNSANGLGIDSQGHDILTTAQFIHSINTPDGQTGNDRMIKPQDTVTINSTIMVDNAHIGQLADILILAGYIHENTTVYFMRQGEQWITWDGATNTLSAAQASLKLPKNLPITVYKGNFIGFNGSFSIYIGYRLAENGSIYFSGEPIQFHLE